MADSFEQPKAKPGNDAYTGMLAVSLFAPLLAVPPSTWTTLNTPTNRREKLTFPQETARLHRTGHRPGEAKGRR